MPRRPDHWDAMWQGSNKETRKQMVLAEIAAKDARQRTWRLAVGLVLSAVPLAIVWGIVSSIAGKATTFNVSIAITIVVTLSGLEALMIARQRGQIKRLRRRVRALEAENRDLKGRNEGADGN